MNINKLSWLVILLGLIFNLGFFFFAFSGQAKTINVHGWAWSENIGWVSFSSTTDNSLIDYGVKLEDTTGDFSGYGWSENIGWVSFNGLGAKIDDPNKLYVSDVLVSGQAKAIAADNNGWDGLMKLRKDAADSGPDYGVSINSAGIFSGWAWASDVMGWVSFNSSDLGAGGSPYQVYLEPESAVLNQPPVAIAFSDKLQYTLGETVYLDGSDSYDPDDGPLPLTFLWSTNPDENFDKTIMNTSFVPGQSGIYQFGLRVFDGDLDDISAIVTIMIMEPAPECGNSAIEAPEECDDGNLTDGDGCSSACEIENPRSRWIKWREAIPF